MSAIYTLLSEAMRERFGGSVTRLSEACEVSVALGSRWVHEDERKRITPSPRSCAKIATALGVDASYVMQLAGHMPADAKSEEPDPIEQMIRARTEEMREAVRDVPRAFWPTIVNAIFDRAIGGARDMARLLNEAESAPAPISDQSDTAVSNPKTRPNTLRGGDQSHLQKDKDGATIRHRMPLLAVGAAL